LRAAGVRYRGEVRATRQRGQQIPSLARRANGKETIMRKVLLAGLVALGVVAGETPARAGDPQAVTRAVERGVAALRSMQAANGSWPHDAGLDASIGAGATALAGLTLLECGAAADDKAVVAAARYVRQEGIRCDYVYGLSTALLFLDRLGDPADVPLIESMAVRLLAGQLRDGGWRYTTPPISADEVRRLEALGRGRPPATRDREPADGKRPTRTLSPEIQRQLDLLARAGPPKTPTVSDNSNTQFAALALWAARRHGMPVGKALEGVEARFRSTQDPGGGWCYFEPAAVGAPDYKPAPSPRDIVPSPTMTCAGVLGLSLAYAADTGGEGEAKDRPRDIAGDKALAKALTVLSTAVGHPAGDRRDVPIPKADGASFYFLWSLARACVALDLPALNKKDWYAWGAEVLLANQQGDGSWRGNYAETGADTCFALLFLKRANLLRELTSSVKGKLKDPAETILRTGGIGGAGLEPGPAGAKPAASARLADDLVKAQAAEQGAMLRKLQETKGVENTEALAFAIPRLEGDVKQKARDALVSRLARLKVESLRQYLQDDEPEIRRAAALACAAKKVGEAIPNLLPLLRDREADVARAAHDALKELSGRDLGADPAAWEAWWKKQGRE
jgi:hypothetical protein